VAGSKYLSFGQSGDVGAARLEAWNVAHSQITLTAQLTGNIGIPRITRITITVLLR
jgi:hypothetical protein